MSICTTGLAGSVDLPNVFPTTTYPKSFAAVNENVLAAVLHYNGGVASQIARIAVRICLIARLACYLITSLRAKARVTDDCVCIMCVYIINSTTNVVWYESQ